MNTLLFHNKYRIPSARLQFWDYAQDGWYYVTICTHKRKCLFGQIKNHEMHLSPLGKLVEKYWQEIPRHFPNVELETFIIMPNHIHGIITINNPQDYVGYHREYDTAKHQLCISPVAKSLPVIIGTFKAAVTRTTNKNNSSRKFRWQTRYYDHVIRKRESMYKISQYILNNPIKWELDRNNPKNVY